MKVKVNIINMGCILMPEAVTVPSLMTSKVSRELLARDTHTHRDKTFRHGAHLC